MADEEQLTVKALRDFLAQFPDNMPIVYSCCSEYTPLSANDIIVQNLYDNGGYTSRVYREKDGALAKPTLTFPGN